MSMSWLRFATPILLLGGCAASAQTTIPSYCSSYPQTVGSGQWQSSRVFYSNGRLSYASDSAQNRIPDYSYAGYKYGQAMIPAVPEVSRISATSGDQTGRIQAALDAVAARTPDANGIRGALVLNAGTYQVDGVVRVNASGVVLRGVGDSTSGTILRAVGDNPHQRSVVILGSGSAWSEVSPRTDITTSFVQVGSRSFSVASTSGFAVGNEVVVHHPSTQAWIDAVDGCGCAPDPDWSPGSMDIVYHRRITAISGSTVTLDAPVYNHLNRSLSQSYLTRISWSYITNAAVESLRIDIVTAGGEDENHAWDGVEVNGAQDSWVRNITALHFGFGGVDVVNSVRITVDDNEANDPVGIRTGGRFYNFIAGHKAQLVLFSRNRLSPDARHGLVCSGGPDTSGIVFYRCNVTNGHDMEGGHMKWTSGVLFDNIIENGSGTLRLINRGDWGTQHGWGSVHSTAWAFNKGMYIQKPPTAQNYGISATGSFPTNWPKPGPQGFVEQKAGSLVPTSLYEAQLCDRLENAGGSTPTPTPTPSPTPTPTTSVPTPTPTPTTPGATPTPTATPTTPPGGGFSGYYRLMARHSGKAVVVAGVSTADGANVYQWDYNDNATDNDEWELRAIDAGYYRVINRHSGKDLTVQGASTANGGDVVQFTYGGATANDEWQPVDLGNGYYRVVNRHSGKVLNVAGASTVNTGNVDQWSWANVNQQQFQIISVP